VLEIGAGCGSITRFLGECCAHVCALESSYKRISILRDRCRDLTNVVPICCNFTEIEFHSPFDLIVIVGALEYAGMFFPDQPNPWSHFLELASQLLQPNGLMILAIENQFGLKYFAGSPEDHTGRPYEGIEGYSPSSPVRTFGRRHLTSLLQNLGFASCVYLPLPDYKLPRVILNSEFSQAKLNLSQWYDAFRPDSTFATTLTLMQLENNGLLCEAANSFLVLASKDPSAVSSPGWAAAAYSLHRKPCFQTSTHLRHTDGHFLVEKVPLFQSTVQEDPAPRVTQSVGIAAYVRGEKLSIFMLRALRYQSARTERHAADLMKEWLAFLRSNATNSDESLNATLPGNFIDCTPFNLMRNETGLHYVDQEWSLASEVTLEWVLFRGLYWFYLTYCDLFPFSLASACSNSFIKSQFSILGYTITQSRFRDLVRKEIDFQRLILPSQHATQSELENIRSNLQPLTSPRIAMRTLRAYTVHKLSQHLRKR
jgi:hypothetical protein